MSILDNPILRAYLEIMTTAEMSIYNVREIDETAARIYLYNGVTVIYNPETRKFYRYA